MVSAPPLQPPQRPAAPTGEAAAAGGTGGDHALGLIQRQTRRLGTLHPKVLADADPEDLHQLRVALRRLRTALGQFAPALVLPESISDGRIARVARRTGLTRDLDVIGERLRTSLLPPLPDSEKKAMRPVLQRLARDRRLAFGQLVEALNSAGYLKLLERLQRWQRRPVFTALGQTALQDRLLEWKLPIVSGLFLHPGWSADDPASEDLHALRKRIKGVRYALENLEPFLDPDVVGWIGQLKRAQDDLGTLHDLQVLQERLADRTGSGRAGAIPSLKAELRRQQQEHWRGWRERAAEMAGAPGRLRLHRHLLGLA